MPLHAVDDLDVSVTASRKLDRGTCLGLKTVLMARTKQCVAVVEPDITYDTSLVGELRRPRCQHYSNLGIPTGRKAPRHIYRAETCNIVVERNVDFDSLANEV